MSNDAQRQTWSTDAAGWVAHEEVFDAAFAPVTEMLLTTSAIEAGHRVLDIGCGSGTLLAAAVDAGAEAVGVDVSDGMAVAARARVPAATVVLADAQSTDLLDAAPGRRFDRVVSRFGVMFFDDPTAAFGSIRRAVADDGTLTFACWRTRAENPVFDLGQDVLRPHLDPEPEEHPWAPGPTSLADADRVRSVLGDAGWHDVAVTPYDFTCDYATDGPGGGSDGVERRLDVILATNTGRRARTQLEPRLGPERWAALLDDVRAHLRAHLVDKRLTMPGAVWIVTARA